MGVKYNSYEMATRKPRVTVYIEPECKKHLKEWATEEKRTLNNLITVILEEAVERKLQSEKCTDHDKEPQEAV